MLSTHLCHSDLNVAQAYEVAALLHVLRVVEIETNVGVVHALGIETGVVVVPVEVIEIENHDNQEGEEML